MAFDLATLDTRANSDAGVWFDLTNLDGKVITDGGKPIRLKIAGKDSAVAKQVVEDMTAKGVKDEDLPGIISKCLLGWSDNIEMDGKPLKYSPDAAVTVASIPHVGDFIIMKSANRANFTTKA